MTIDFKTIGRRIKAYRIQMNMTQAELAEKTDLSNVYISYVETGAKGVSLTSLLKIANILNLSLDSLILDDSRFRLPQGYHEFAELLKDCDAYERELILNTASAYKKVLRTERNS